jgi:hypothetical protein
MLEINQRIRARWWSGALGGILVSLVMVAVLAACGSSGGSTTGSTTGSAPGTAGPSPTAQKCGAVLIVRGNQFADQAAAKQAENCFWQAYQHCQAATLRVTTMGVDAGTIRLFTITPKAGSCQVTDAVQTYVVPNHTSAVTTYTCSGVKQQASGLLFQSCGQEGNVSVPPDSTQQ